MSRKPSPPRYPSAQELKRAGRLALTGLGLGALLASGCSAASAEPPPPAKSRPDAGELAPAPEPIKMGKVAMPDLHEQAPAPTKPTEKPKKP